MRSMTGFGKSQIKRNGIELEIDIKAVNSRYLDIKYNLSRELSFFESKLRLLLHARLNRGMIEVKASLTDRREAVISINESKLLSYYALFQKASKLLGISNDINLDTLINEPGVIQAQNSYADDAVLDKILTECCNQALSQLIISQSVEGKQIKNTLQNSIKSISKALATIQKSVKTYKGKLFNDMKQRVKELLTEDMIDIAEQRLLQEIAIFIDKYDIQEEITRLHNHISVFKTKLGQNSNDGIGKSMNFILQEMQREANTLGSKYSTVESFGDILMIKEEIEKCREIIQNVT